MFLTRAGFKRLIAGAYKNGGLHIVNTGVGYQIFGIGFNMSIKKGCIPKESLGDLIALIGELPAEGEAFSATKKGIQYEIQETTPQTAFALFHACNTDMEATRALFVSSDVIRVLQNDDYMNGVVTISEEHYELIRANAIGELEELPIGPKVRYMGDGHFSKECGICWENNVMAISFYFGDTSQVENELALLSVQHIMRTTEEV